jgi:hypothetical protein
MISTPMTTPMDHIRALEAERQALYAHGHDDDPYKALQKRIRLQEIEIALPHYWALERAARAERRQAEETPAWATVAAPGRR